MLRHCFFLFGILLTIALPAAALLPAAAVDLSKVKIPEKQKSEDLCPVHLVPSKADGPSWAHEGVSYREAHLKPKTFLWAIPQSTWKHTNTNAGKTILSTR